MFTGFNSDVEFDGQVYHVQTEDKGLGNPVVETRVYVGGQVVASVSHSYADLADSPDYSHDRIEQRMQEQHRNLIEDLEHGRLDADTRVRLRAEVRDPDPDNLIEEYLESWIETSQQLAPVHNTLEREIDNVQQSAQKKKLY